MQKVVALVLVVLGGLLALKTLAATWLLLLILAAAFAWAASSKTIGKWGYAAALGCALLAVPGFILGTVLKGIAIAFSMMKLFPIILVILGVYMLFKSFK